MGDPNAASCTLGSHLGEFRIQNAKLAEECGNLQFKTLKFCCFQLYSGSEERFANIMTVVVFFMGEENCVKRRWNASILHCYRSEEVLGTNGNTVGKR